MICKESVNSAPYLGRAMYFASDAVKGNEHRGEKQVQRHLPAS